MKRRFLVFFSYIGKCYNGLQAQFSRDSTRSDTETIQGIVELGLSSVFRVKPKEIVFNGSSRTDSGVHALSSSAHVDIDTDKLPYKDIPYSPDRITRLLNSYLEEHLTDIRVNRIVEVPTDFFSRRNAHSRVYCYRFAIIKDFCPNYSSTSIKTALPLTEIYRCGVFVPPFNLELVQKTCKLFLGTRNFLTFMKYSPEAKNKTDVEFTKTIFRVSLSNVDYIQNYNFDPNYKNLNFYEFQVQGSGFLRQQVRRIVGSLLSIGSGVINLEDLQWMLDNPGRGNWHKKCITVPPDGLFLKTINYPNLPSIILRGYLS